MNKTLKRTLLNSAIISTFIMSQSVLAATYTPPEATNPGRLHYDNILINSGGSLGANLTAADNGRLYAGQVYLLDVRQLALPTGDQDATYTESSQQLAAQNIIETPDISHDAELVLTGFDAGNPNLAHFTVMELTTRIQGPQGDTGLRGPQGFAGSPGSQGERGATGTKGNTILTGDTDATGGVDGDFYINTTDNTIAGPKANDVWPPAVNLVGPTGPQGATGDIGPTGPQGATGIQGLQGLPGIQGPTGAQGATGIQGPTGPQGATGLQGETGATGATGPAGTSIPDGTTNLDVLTWDGGVWLAKQPVDQITGTNKMQPYQVVSYIIALQGIYPSRNGIANPTIGEITMFAGNFAPRDWAFCNGQLLAIADNTALFSLLGTMYGGDGQVTFALPDLRGRAALHHGTGPGLTPKTIGEKGGSETH